MINDNTVYLQNSKCSAITPIVSRPNQLNSVKFTLIYAQHGPAGNKYFN